MWRRTAIWLHIDPEGRKTRLLHAEQLGDFLLERDHGRVEAPLFVADLGVGHRLAHLVARLGLGV